MKTKDIDLDGRVVSIKQLPAKVWIDLQKKADVQGDGIEVLCHLISLSLAHPSFDPGELSLPDLRNLVKFK